mgnify:CR=1 FL=1
MRTLTALLIAIAAFAVAPLAQAGVAAPTSTGRASTDNVCHDTQIILALVGKHPGDLLAAPQDVTAESGLATDAGRLYRIAYATTGEAGAVVASCGLVAVPANTTTAKGVIAWAHGTIGLMQNCQPSEKPTGFVGAMPGGIGAVTPKGTQQDGALYGMLKAGYAVTATDYPSAGLGADDMQYYVLGVPAAMAVIDSARVLTGNAAAFGLTPVAPDAQLPFLPWGHSQGGGSALWAGQLAKPYLAAQGDQTLNLVGVAGEAPASQFTTSPGQPAAYMGGHLGDRDIYNTTPGLGFPLQIGVALFSYVTVSWSNVTKGTEGAFPVGPTQHVDFRDVLTSGGTTTAPLLAKCCLGLKDAATILKQTSEYYYPSLKRFFAEPFAGAPVKGTWEGGIDSTCASPPAQPAAFGEWCKWLQFNMPGPYGVNAYPKLPRNSAGEIAPLFIAQGANDHIIWCVDTTGAVQGANCLTAQYTHSVHESYCDGGHYLNVQYYPGVGHMDIPGAAARVVGGTTYAGSQLQQFVDGAMSGTLGTRCTVDPDATSAAR